MLVVLKGGLYRHTRKPYHAPTYPRISALCHERRVGLHEPLAHQLVGTGVTQLIVVVLEVEGRCHLRHLEAETSIQMLLAV